MKPNLATHIEPRVTDQDRFVLSLLMKKVSGSSPVIAEIGSFLGNGSTSTLIKAMNGRDGKIYCIDTWKGNQNVEWHLNLAEEFSLFDTFLHHVAEADGKDIVKPMVMESLDAAAIFREKSLDLVFIDGDHSYQSVKNDIEAWRDKIKPGGVLCGHDCEGAMADFAPEIIHRNLDKDFVNIENFTFQGAHPGSVKAVDECLDSAATIWAHIDLAEHSFHGRSTIWSVEV